MSTEGGTRGGTAAGSPPIGDGPSIAAFYEADERRRESEETVYGDGWTRHDDITATYRLSLVQDTGELYLVREPHPGGVLARFYDQLGIEQASVDELTVEILTTTSSEQADQLLDGWDHAMTGSDSLGWVRERVGSV